MNTTAERLADGPPRGLGAANLVAREAARNAETLQELVAAIDDPRARVQARAANALKKLQGQQPALLAPYAQRLLRSALRCKALEAQWNLTVVLGELPLRGRERALATELFFEELRSQSALLRTFALTALCSFAVDDEPLQARLRPVLAEFAANGTAAMQARARKLLAGMVASEPPSRPMRR